jgi:hypothetical protein
MPIKPQAYFSFTNTKVATDPDPLPQVLFSAYPCSYNDASVQRGGRGGPLALKPMEVAFGDYTPGRWAWALSHVQAFATPVSCKGALSLWTVPEAVEAQLPFSSTPIPAIS